ncbi:hypothetical protein [Mucilaginibacter sp. L196]|uniref:hypothetical protein n=1 Tax=Mucilaginibacter sp. L196 TaxID=1641870 RepID=UPI00131C6E9A|nr:hypothetical protein [Mucilaginibacter sp. L196]
MVNRCQLNYNEIIKTKQCTLSGWHLIGKIAGTDQQLYFERSVDTLTYKLPDNPAGSGSL